MRVFRLIHFIIYLYHDSSVYNKWGSEDEWWTRQISLEKCVKMRENRKENKYFTFRISHSQLEVEKIVNKHRRKIY